MTGDARVSVVVATRNRSGSACRQAQWALSQQACAEAIFVVDGAEDDTLPRLRSLAETDARLRVIALDQRMGVPAAKNIGVRAASHDWILLLDDDDTASEGFLDALLWTAHDAGADIVGAPWFNLTGGQDLESFIANAPRRQGGPVPERPGIFPEKKWEECFWLPMNVLIKRELFDRLSFDEGYRGNFYREETDIMVSAARAGYRVVVTSLAYSYLRQRVSGGIERGSRLRYEYWVFRNNWRFLRKHGGWLRDAGFTRGRLYEQTALVIRRARPMVRAVGRRFVSRTAKA